MKRRALSFDALASKVSKQSNKPNSKVIFNRLSLNEIKKYPEIVPAIKNERKLSFDILSSDKPQFHAQDIKDAHNSKLSSNIDIFRNIFFDYTTKEKKSFHNYHSIHKYNDVFEHQYSKIKKRTERISKQESQFDALKSQYENRKIKIPNVSIKHNLFKQNLLLLEGKEMENYLLYQEPTQISKDKSISYLDKICESLIDKRTASKQTSMIQLLPQKSKEISGFKYEKKNAALSPRSECKKTKKEINQIKSTFSNINKIDNFFLSKKKTDNKFKLASRESSAIYSTRVNSASQFNNITKQPRIIISKLNNENANRNEFKRKSLKNVYSYISNVTNQSKSSSSKNILKLSKNIENLYEKIVSDSEDTKKYDKEMKEYLNEHNYKKSNDVSPKMIYQQINNSKNKISINELIANNIELKHKKRNNNVLNLKERAMIKKNNSINSINNSINECEKDFCKIVFNVYK